MAKTKKKTKKAKKKKSAGTITRIGDMKGMPRKAGIADLEFNSLVDTPHMDEGNKIVFPDKPDDLFIRLKGRKQFLYVRKRVKIIFSVWFGGTDENVFLVRLERDAYEAYQKGGAKAFYEFLKPKSIKILEKIFGKGRTLRQGDIWAYPLPRVSWKTLGLLYNLGMFCDYVQPSNRVQKYRVLNTNHRVKGRYAESEDNLKDNLNYESNFAVGEGVLTAKDHKPVTLKGPHVLALTEGLIHGSD